MIFVQGARSELVIILSKQLLRMLAVRCLLDLRLRLLIPGLLVQMGYRARCLNDVRIMGRSSNLRVNSANNFVLTVVRDNVSRGMYLTSLLYAVRRLGCGRLLLG